MTEDITVDLPMGLKERVDRFVASTGLLSRAQIKTRNLRAFQGNKEIKLSFKVKQGDIIHLQWDDLQDIQLEPEEMDLDILFENEEVTVINKPRGLVVHPAVGNWTGTLVQGLLYHNRIKPDDSETLRPGIVHRLDKDTSGVIITARNYESQEALSAQFRERETEKTYLAIVKNRPKKMAGSIEGFIQRDPNNRKRFIMDSSSRGKWSLSHYRVLKLWKGYALVEIHIETGRTHQIRVHMLHIGCPILGDPIYGRKDPEFIDTPLMLHSWKLGIQLPGEEEKRFFEAPLPEDFIGCRDLLDLRFSI